VQLRLQCLPLRDPQMQVIRQHRMYNRLERRIEIMAENPRGKKMTNIQSSDTTSPGGRAAASECRSDMMACSTRDRGFKGLFLMIACCGAPLLLLLALPVLGSVLGGRSTPAVSTLAVLACPVGMALMMWMMRRGQRAGTQQLIQEPPASVSRAAVVPPAGSHHEAVLPRQD
jgi:hypothetical protein